MYVINKTAQDVNGNAIAGAPCFVYARGTTTIVPITDAAGAPKDNPFFSAAGGLIQFSAEPGEYDLRVLSGQSDSTIPISIIGSAGLTDSGADPDETPQNSDLGSAAYTQTNEYSFVFNSVAEMVSSEKLKIGQSVKTLGYHSLGDGGGNDYEIVAAGTGTDDGGSYIDLSGSGLQAKGLFIKENVSIKQFGFTGAGEEGGIFDAALAYCSINNRSFSLEHITILTDGPHTVPEGLRVLCNDTTVRRFTFGYTGTDELLIIESSVSVSGDITVDGNFPDESGVFEDSYSSVLVNGDDVTIEKISCINTPMPSGLDKQLSGCMVYGDGFNCSHFKGDFCGYRSLGLTPKPGMTSFRVGKFESYNHHYKGFSIGGNVGDYVDLIKFDTFIASTPDNFSHDASEGLLSDGDNDNNLIFVGNLVVDTMIISGGRSNCLKVENVDNFKVGLLNLDVTTTLPAGQACRIESRKFYCQEFIFNKNRIRIRALNTNVENLICDHGVDAGGVPHYVILEALEPVGADISLQGDRSYRFGKVEALANNPVTYLLGLNIQQNVSYKLEVVDVNAPFVSHMTANYDLAFNGLNKMRDGAIIFHNPQDRSLLNPNSIAQKYIQVGSRVFFSNGGEPTEGIYRQADYVINGQATILGTAPDQYVKKGWLCVTGGDETVFNFVEDILSV